MLCHSRWCRIASQFKGLSLEFGVSIWALKTGRPVGLSSGLMIILSNGVDRDTTGSLQVINTLILGGYRWLVQIIVGSMCI